MSNQYDVTIVGGGMVGASLALALLPLGLRVALVEAIPYDSAAQPSFDERTTAISNGSRRILEGLGIWSAISMAATPIAKIHISDQGHFGFARVDARDRGLLAMGYVIPNRVLGAALWTKLLGAKSRATENLTVFCPASIEGIVADERTCRLALTVGGVHSELESQILVAADGVNSAVRQAFGIEASVRDYGQTAVITTVLPQRFHDHVAYERFTTSGPLALLPLEGGRCTLVLTLSPEMAAAAITWSDVEFLRELQQRFGFRLGRFLQVGRRVPYPLSLTQAQRTSAGRCVIVGNAAQGLHPVAGMGFNLGLRDAACLAELVAQRHKRGTGDLWDLGLMAAYDAWRAADRGGIIAFTDTLVRTFSSPLRTVQGLRNFGLLAFDLLPPAKSALSRLSTGAATRVPKLARGVSLV